MTKTLKSFTSNAQYFTTIDEQTGRMTDCRCPSHAKWDPNHEGGCKHMREFNEQMRKLEAFQQAWHALDYRSQAQRDARATARISMELALGW